MRLTAALPIYFALPQSSAYGFGFHPRQRYVVQVRPQPSSMETVRTLQSPIDAFFQDPFELDPFFYRERALMRREENMLARFFRDFDETTDMMTRRKNLSARREVIEKSDSFEISIVLPTDMEAKDVSLELLQEDQVLYLSGKTKVEKDNILSQSRISRMFKMGTNADTKNISAKISEGVLHVTVPKLEKEEKKQGKKIDIVQESPVPVTKQKQEKEDKEGAMGPTRNDIVMQKSESVENDKEEAEHAKAKHDDDDEKKEDENEADEKVLDLDEQEE